MQDFLLGRRPARRLHRQSGISGWFARGSAVERAEGDRQMCTGGRSIWQTHKTRQTSVTIRHAQHSRRCMLSASPLSTHHVVLIILYFFFFPFFLFFFWQGCAGASVCLRGGCRQCESNLCWRWCVVIERVAGREGGGRELSTVTQGAIACILGTDQEA